MAKSETVVDAFFEPLPSLAATTLSAGPRVIIRNVSPDVDNGRFPARAVVDQAVVVEADIFTDGHERLSARLLWRHGERGSCHSVPMEEQGNDRWSASFVPQKPGRHTFTIEAWIDVWGSFRADLAKKVTAGVVENIDILDGRSLLRTAAKRSGNAALARLDASMEEADLPACCEQLLSESTAGLMAAADTQAFLEKLSPALGIDADRQAAVFASWYELFPRSQSGDPQVHGTFDDVIARLPAIRAMGFDVLYIPPIHPIGTTHRKGRDNNLRAQPDDPGSPYAIGGSEGGHEAVHPQLGGIEAFRRLRRAAAEQQIELALDFAIQCSPDHPWLKHQPAWFSRRADGSIRYAENPPKKYEDIVNVDFYAPEARPALWLALRDVVLKWIGEGVRIFRVDNPHTKPLPFWQWMIADVRARHPDTIFLSEAFTRPARMYQLAMIGFSQSYTYFTWRNTREELEAYLTELTRPPLKHFFRPHFFVNTPDINPYFLQTSGRPGFLIRAALAATLSGLWGLYSGFELCEAAPVPGREEYLHAEMYELKPRDWNAPGNIIAEISQLNRIRRDHPALQSHLGLRFHKATNEQVLYFSKATADRSSIILVAISLDPHQPQETHFELPLEEFGFADNSTVESTELMRDTAISWRGRTQHWYFDPEELPFAIWRINAPGRATP